jgi:hypothetical protein
LALAGDKSIGRWTNEFRGSTIGESEVLFLDGTGEGALLCGMEELVVVVNGTSVATG